MLVRSSRRGKGRVLGCSRTDGPSSVDAAPNGTPSSAIVVQKGDEGPLPPPRWPPSLAPQPLPAVRLGWAEGRAALRKAVYGSRAVRVAAAVQDSGQLDRAVRALAQHALAPLPGHAPPRVTAAWRSRSDVHRFLCHCAARQRVEGPYKLRSPDTSLLLPSDALGPPPRGPALARPAWELPYATTRRSQATTDINTGPAKSGGLDSAATGAAVGGGDGSHESTPLPTLAEALQCAVAWTEQRVYVQVDIATLVRRGGEAAGGFMGSGGDGVRDPLPMLLGCSDADAEAGGPGSSGLAVVPREEGGTGGSGGWCATCLDILAPAVRWLRGELLGSCWQLPPQELLAICRRAVHSAANAPATDGSGLPGGAAGPAAAPAADIEGSAAALVAAAVAARALGGAPYSGGVLSLEWSAAGALLPLRTEPHSDRVVVQLCGRRRVLLVAAEHALPGLAPFPALHPYDGYSMPAVAHTLVHETPGVDVGRAVQRLGAQWPSFDKVRGVWCVLEPGDALLIPAGWFLHSEMLPCAQGGARTPTSAQSASSGQPSGKQEQHHLEEQQLPPGVSHVALIATLTPRRPAAGGAGAGPGRREVPTPGHAGAGPGDGEASAAAGRSGTGMEAEAEAEETGSAGGCSRLCVPLSGATALQQLARLLEVWTAPSEVPLAELRSTLMELAGYHEERRSLEAEMDGRAGSRGCERDNGTEGKRDRPAGERERGQAHGADGGAGGEPHTRGGGGSGMVYVPQCPDSQGSVGQQQQQQQQQQEEQREQDGLCAGPQDGATAARTGLEGAAGAAGCESIGKVLPVAASAAAELESQARVGAGAGVEGVAAGEPTRPSCLDSTGLEGPGKGGSNWDCSSMCSDPNDISSQASRCLGGGQHPEPSGSRSKGSSNGGSGTAGSSSRDDPAASQPGQGPQPDPLLERLLRHQLHPTFNERTPRGRVMAELYDMLVRHVEPAADRALAAVGAADGSTAVAVAAEGSTPLSRLIRLACTDRLLPTDWVNQLCRDLEVRREVLQWYDDTRTADEGRFPELYRLQVASAEARSRATTLRPAAQSHGALLLPPGPATPTALPPAPRGRV